MKDYKLLSEKELLQLLQEENDHNAMNELFERNKKFISFVLKRFKVLPKDRDEVYNVATIGFTRACYCIDCTRDIKITTFSYLYIIGEVARYYRDNYENGFRLSRNDYDNVKLIKKTIRNFVKEHGREPNDEEISSITGLPINEVILLSKISGSINSLDKEVYDKDDNPNTNLLKEAVSIDSFENDTCERLDLLNAINQLSEREKLFIKMYYYENKTHSQIAKEVGTSQSCVTRTLKRSYKKLKDILEG